jgi:hypothetical protein
LRAGRNVGKELVVVSHPTSATSDDRILSLAEWMGVPTRKIVVEDESLSILPVLERTAGSDSCVAVSVETLAAAAKTAGSAGLRQFIDAHIGQLLVFTCGHSAATGETLDWLTGGRIGATRSGPGEHAFCLPENGRKYSKQFAGLGFSSDEKTSLPTLDAKEPQSPCTELIMLADNRPVFLRMACGSCELFLLAVSEIPDIDTRLSQDKRIEEFYDRLIPLLLFLRHCFGEKCWHGRASTARVIIDDPLLGSSYGFLDYPALLKSMRTLEYGTSVAFIPWNHWRTSRQAAARFLGQEPYFSICVHGCDHTNKEFGLVDQGRLQWKASTALRRMEKHEQQTGLWFERVMVFPQGWFSTPAIKALRANNYLGAINTTCFPTNEHSDHLTISDFLRPAVTRFYGLPIFQRRYPKRLIDYAFDVFLGKPALVVEHHQYFRDGYGKLEEFVEELHKIEPTLVWPTLSDQLTHCCITKTVSEKTSHVQFFTRRFQFHNTRSVRTNVLLAKHEPDPSVVSKVLVDGQSVDFSFRKDSLVLETEADPGQTVDVEVVDGPRPAKVAHRPGLSYRVGVPVRRALSEFRDNTLTKHPRLLDAATGLARKMKATADHDREDPG